MGEDCKQTKKNVHPRKLELLAPARDAKIAVTAINCGADAVYMGGPHHGARAAAANSTEDIRRVCTHAHKFGAKVYVTLNTLVYDSELDAVRNSIRELYSIGVDALIIQDLGILRMDIPPIALHASTQCDCRTPEKAQFMASLGVDCIVVPREFNLRQIKEMRNALSTDVRLEAFVHGALCVSYSGDCRASFVNGGRSANRGECAQICRLPYNLCDIEGKIYVSGSHLLSLKDLNRLKSIGLMAEAGVDIFKIEGRLKDASYVANIVSLYSRELDRICRSNPDKYVRASLGRVEDVGFNPDAHKVFNRGFTDYGITGDGTLEPGQISSPLTPKWTGEEVGTVGRLRSPRQFDVKGGVELHNGDGLGYFDKKSNYTGFRVNRVAGNVINVSSPVNITPGTVLFRNHDHEFERKMEVARPRRVIPVKMTLRECPGGVVLEVVARSLQTTPYGVCVMMEYNADTAEKPQEDAQRRVLEKTGDTIFASEEILLECLDRFIPASVLTQLRRKALTDLEHCILMRHPVILRLPEQHDSRVPVEMEHLGTADNVANKLAEKLYNEHGATVDEKAAEVTAGIEDAELRVMTTRHCLRRDLHACLRRPGDANPLHLPASSLFLRHPSGDVRPMRLDFDCARCRMIVTVLPGK